MRRLTILQTALLLLVVTAAGCELIGIGGSSDRQGLDIQTSEKTYQPGDEVKITVQNVSGQTVYLRMCTGVDKLPMYNMEKKTAEGWRAAGGTICPRIIIERRMEAGDVYGFTTPLEGFVQTLDTIPGTYRYQFRASYRSWHEGGEKQIPTDLTISNVFEVVE